MILAGDRAIVGVEVAVGVPVDSPVTLMLSGVYVDFFDFPISLIFKNFFSFFCSLFFCSLFFCIFSLLIMALILREFSLFGFNFNFDFFRSSLSSFLSFFLVFLLIPCLRV